MGTPRGEPQLRRRTGWHMLGVVAGALLLFALGLLQGLIGSFHYSSGPGPLVAILLDLLIFATCVLAGWGLRTYGSGVLPAVGWLIASFILSMPRSNGSVVITASAAGEWYLYGGALAAAAGAGTAFVVWAKHRLSPGGMIPPGTPRIMEGLCPSIASLREDAAESAAPPALRRELEPCGCGR